MTTSEAKTQYKATIGIECHVQLKTKTKLFAAVGNDARDAEPNTLISHICLGMPGALPVLNEQAVALAVRAAFALKSRPQHISNFDRKHYFYPDLPLGYQITQFYKPIILGGEVDISVDGKSKTIKITRAHLEADAGKNSHPTGSDYSLVDLNRAGTPLLEIVSEPDINSPAEARAYAHELYLLMKYADVSDADLFHGNMRFDVNVSVSKTDELGVRTETKNLNSFKSIEKAAEYEISRQIELLEKGEAIDQETRGWDDGKQKTFSQRGKEQAHDYRYMPEPDIPPVVLEDAYIDNIEQSMPAMPEQWRNMLSSINVDPSQIEILLDAEDISSNANYLAMLSSSLGQNSDAESVNEQTRKYVKQLANWMVNIEIPFRSESENAVMLNDADRASMYEAISELTEANKLSSSNAKLLIQELLTHESIPHQDNGGIEKYADEQGFIQVSDTGEIDRIVIDIITANPQAAEDVRKGEMKAIGFLVGQVMKSSQGKANPALAQDLIKKHLSSN